MKVFNQLPENQRNDIESFNAIHFDLHNFTQWVSNPNLPHKEIHAEFTKFLIKLYLRYESKNTSYSEAHLENS